MGLVVLFVISLASRISFAKKLRGTTNQRWSLRKIQPHRCMTAVATWCQTLGHRKRWHVEEIYSGDGGPGVILGEKTERWSLVHGKSTACRPVLKNFLKCKALLLCRPVL